MCRVPLLLQLTDIVTGQSGALLVLKQGTTLLVSDGEVVDAGTALASIPSWGWGTSFDRPYGGLETFRQLLSAAVPDHPAPIAPISGEIRWDGESPFVDIVPEDGGAFMRLAIPAADWELRIMPGMFVEAGDWLTASLIDPSTLLAAIGWERFAAHLVDELLRCSRNANATLTATHAEIAVRAMLSESEGQPILTGLLPEA